MDTNVKNYLSLGLPNVKNYLFLGLPGSGKSTYFTLMMRHFIKVTGQMKNINVRPATLNVPNSLIQTGTKATDFLKENARKIARQEWPDKTPPEQPKGYAFKVERDYEFLGLSTKAFFNSQEYITFFDYSGEAFEDLGLDAPRHSEEMTDISDRAKKASGIFFMIDAEALFNGEMAYSDSLGNAVTRLADEIADCNPSLKIAFIFTKLEKCQGLTFSRLPKMLKNIHPVIGNLSCEHKFFYDVLPLGDIDINSDGEFIPPKKLHTRKLLEPIRWMLDLTPSDIEKFIVLLRKSGLQLISGGKKLSKKLLGTNEHIGI